MKPIIVLLIVFLSVVGCGKQEEGPRPGYFTENSTPVSDVERSRNKYLAYEHSVSVDTDEDGAKELYSKVISTCKADSANGCTLLDSSLTTGRRVSARIKIRAKPEGIRNLIEIVSASGQLVNQATHVEDLARPIIDSNKRLEMLKQYQKRLIKLEREATNDVDSLIKVSKELATVQSAIEQAAGENAHLLDRVNMDILNISISTRLNRSFWSPVVEAISAFSSNLSNGIASALIALAYVLPWAVTILIFAVIGRQAWRWYRRRT
jgi:hypothetical protein